MFKREDSLKAANKVELTKEQQDKLLQEIHSIKSNKKALASRLLLKRKCRILVLLVIEKYLDSGLSLTELARLGEIGLDAAISKWKINYKRKHKFVYYALWFIRAEIHKELGLPVDVEGYGEIRKEK